MSRRFTRRNYNEKVEPEVEEEFDDEEQETTRCVCGSDDLNTDGINPQLTALLKHEYHITVEQGLFIQCDKCSVWQHGYCVGLFTDDDVPDKYWCEVCKPDLHIFVYEGNDHVRTLYKPVNDKRKKLMVENEKFGSKRKFTRKERRNYDYDEQLQKALRESAKESGLSVQERDKRAKSAQSAIKEEADDVKSEQLENNDDVDDDNNENNNGSNTSTGPTSTTISTENGNSTSTAATSVTGDISQLEGGTTAGIYEAEVGDEEDEAEMEEDETTPSIKKEIKRKPPKKIKKKDNKSKIKKPKSDEKNKPPVLTKEDLLNQPSKPRYVNEKLSIYELRKRINAILEWLNRSQLELEDEKENKLSLINNTGPGEDELEHKEINNQLITNYNHNLTLMQSLTSRILEWEEKFGKYAP